MDPARGVLYSGVCKAAVLGSVLEEKLIVDVFFPIVWNNMFWKAKYSKISKRTIAWKEKFCL